MKLTFSNQLVHSSSPYLLQHAHNPVNWYPWENRWIEKAKSEQKLILISIGYSACHWCHVMENESFTDPEVAKVMNKNFVNIKVDREERPDVDHYYMTALQMMGLQGGWPLNIIALPDGRPVWGGTYFTKELWIKNLLNVARFYAENREKTEEYAGSLQKGIAGILLNAQIDHIIPAHIKIAENGVKKWKTVFDTENGGRRGYPKFPMPVNLNFLMHYGILKKDATVLSFVKLTLKKMSRGGIYDQVGGGFARYSVDDKWKIPHFEKMLYDNGQLLSVYSKAFRVFGEEEFKNVVYETVDYIESEMMDISGGFYSSLDADSEGVEGKYYTWSKVELEKIIKGEFDLFSGYFGINSTGYWESGNYILVHSDSDDAFAKQHHLSHDELRTRVRNWKSVLSRVRSARVKPSLDDKIMISWNALVILGLTDAYQSFGERRFLDLAEKNAGFIVREVLQPDGQLFHTWKKGQSGVTGFLEDYAYVIRAFISLAEVTGQMVWLEHAGKMLDYAMACFYEPEAGLFYFSSKDSTEITGNFFPKEDNVTPAANSVMAENLYLLYLLLGQENYLRIAKRMLHHITPLFTDYASAYANWGNTLFKISVPFYEIVICGERASEFYGKLSKDFRPDVVFAFTLRESDVPIFKNRFIKGKTLVYICREGTCLLPVESVEEAKQMLEEI